MPKDVEDTLRRQYGKDDHAVFGTMNKMGMMHGNQITALGRQYSKDDHQRLVNHFIRQGLKPRG